MSMPRLEERPQATDARVKRTNPHKKIRTLPIRSATFPKTRRRLVTVTRYEVITHWDWATSARKYRVMVGRAMDTTEPSITNMKMPSRMMKATIFLLATAGSYEPENAPSSGDEFSLSRPFFVSSPSRSPPASMPAFLGWIGCSFTREQ